MGTNKKGVVLTVRRSWSPTAYFLYVNEAGVCRHDFERLTKIRLKPGEACRVRVTRVK